MVSPLHSRRKPRKPQSSQLHLLGLVHQQHSNGDLCCFRPAGQKAVPYSEVLVPVIAPRMKKTCHAAIGRMQASARFSSVVCPSCLSGTTRSTSNGAWLATDGSRQYSHRSPARERTMEAILAGTRLIWRAFCRLLHQCRKATAPAADPSRRRHPSGCRVRRSRLW